MLLMYVQGFFIYLQSLQITAKKSQNGEYYGKGKNENTVNAMYPSFEQMQKIIKYGDYGICPISLEMYADSITPIKVMKILKRLADTAICWKASMTGKTGDDTHF